MLNNCATTTYNHIHVRQLVTSLQKKPYLTISLYYYLDLAEGDEILHLHDLAVDVLLELRLHGDIVVQVHVSVGLGAIHRRPGRRGLLVSNRLSPLAVLVGGLGAAAALVGVNGLAASVVVVDHVGAVRREVVQEGIGRHHAEDSVINRQLKC